MFLADTILYHPTRQNSNWLPQWGHIGHGFQFFCRLKILLTPWAKTTQPIFMLFDL